MTRGEMTTPQLAALNTELLAVVAEMSKECQAAKTFVMRGYALATETDDFVVLRHLNAAIAAAERIGQ